MVTRTVPLMPPPVRPLACCRRSRPWGASLSSPTAAVWTRGLAWTCWRGTSSCLWTWMVARCVAVHVSGNARRGRVAVSSHVLPGRACVWHVQRSTEVAAILDHADFRAAPGVDATSRDFRADMNMLCASVVGINQQQPRSPFPDDSLQGAHSCVPRASRCRCRCCTHAHSAPRALCVVASGPSRPSHRQAASRTFK